MVRNCSQNQCQNINTSSQSRLSSPSSPMKNFTSLQPESQLHCTKRVNDHNLEIAFRYFSPSQFKRSKADSRRDKHSLEHRSQESESMIGQESVLQDCVKELNPYEFSDKFYCNLTQEIQNPLLHYYEQFHLKLLRKNHLTLSSAHNKVIKIKLTKDVPVAAPPHQPQDVSAIRKQPKNVQINLQEQSVYVGDTRITKGNVIRYQKPANQQVSQNASILTPLTHKQPQLRSSQKIKIKLYEDRSTQNKSTIRPKSDVFKTPSKERTHSNRKGIEVYSSSNKRKKLSSQKANRTQQKQNRGNEPVLSDGLNRSESQNRHRHSVNKIHFHVFSSKRETKTSIRRNKCSQAVSGEKRPERSSQRLRVYSKEKAKNGSGGSPMPGDCGNRATEGGRRNNNRR